MSRLFLVRHGNTFDPGDVVTRVGGRTDLPLSLSGQAQARALAEHFAQSDVRFARAFCSPLRRTRETAEAILGGAAALETLAFLREIDYGPDENRPEADVVARVGAQALERWEREGVPPPGWVVDPTALTEGWRGLFSALAGGAGSCLAVTSNGVARFALAAAGAQGAFPNKLRTGAFGEIEIGGDGAARVLRWDVRP